MDLNARLTESTDEIEKRLDKAEYLIIKDSAELYSLKEKVESFARSIMNTY